LARLLAGDAQITHLPPHEQGPCAYQYQHLDELERHGALAIGPLALLQAPKQVHHPLYALVKAALG
jgi:hypothetical protein